MRELERTHVVRRRTDRSVAHHRPGREWLPLAGDQVRALQDAERRRPRGDEAPADHLRARSRQPAALPQMRQGGPASIRDSATIRLAASPPANRSLTDVQSLLCRPLDYADHWLETGSGGGDRCFGVGIITVPPETREACRSVEIDREELP